MELIATYFCKTFNFKYHKNSLGFNKLNITDDVETSFDSLLCDTPRLIVIKFNSLVFKLRVNTGSVIKVYGKIISANKLFTRVQIEIKKYNMHNGQESILTQNQITEVRLKRGAPTNESLRKINLKTENRVFARNSNKFKEKTQANKFTKNQKYLLKPKLNTIIY